MYSVISVMSNLTFGAVVKYSFVFQIKILMQFLARVSMQSKEFRIIWGSCHGLCHAGAIASRISLKLFGC